MGKLLRFPAPDDARMRSALEDVRDDVERMSDELRRCAIRLATEGVWREWADAQPEGAAFKFHPEMLLSSGDEAVRVLVQLDLATEALVVEIEQRLRRAGHR